MTLREILAKRYKINNIKVGRSLLEQNRLSDFEINRLNTNLIRLDNIVGRDKNDFIKFICSSNDILGDIDQLSINELCSKDIRYNDLKKSYSNIIDEKDRLIPKSNPTIEKVINDIITTVSIYHPFYDFKTRTIFTYNGETISLDKLYVLSENLNDKTYDFIIKYTPMFYDEVLKATQMRLDEDNSNSPEIIHIPKEFFEISDRIKKFAAENIK